MMPSSSLGSAIRKTRHTRHGFEGQRSGKRVTHVTDASCVTRVTRLRLVDLACARIRARDARVQGQRPKNVSHASRPADGALR